MKSQQFLTASACLILLAVFLHSSNGYGRPQQGFYPKRNTQNSVQRGTGKRAAAEGTQTNGAFSWFKRRIGARKSRSEHFIECSFKCELTKAVIKPRREGITACTDCCVQKMTGYMNFIKGSITGQCVGPNTKGNQFNLIYCDCNYKYNPNEKLYAFQ